MEKQIVELLDALRGLIPEEAQEGSLFEQIRSLYPALGERDKDSLFQAIISEIEVPKEGLMPVLDQLISADQDSPAWPGLVSELRNRLQSPRLRIFRKISHQPGGLKFLLDFRRDLISAQRSSTMNLKPLDADIVLLFELWFQDGFLFLEEITLDSAYRQIELIKNSDLVHPMTSIEEMGKRLGKDRRCFALYHRLMPYEPIVFIEVALTRGIVKNIADIIQGTRPLPAQGEADTAIFYSINNTQHGLAGLRLGKMLIGRVVDYLKKEKEPISTFATLSPLPGFWKSYLKPILEGKDQPFQLKAGEVESFFSRRQVRRILQKSPLADGEQSFQAALLSLLSGEDWVEDEQLKKDLQGPLLKIAYLYITREKNRENKPLNPVANFHLENGATVSRQNVNFLGNPSPRGLLDSCGIMVNYIYTAGWLSQLRGSLRWLEKMEMKGIFSRRP